MGDYYTLMVGAAVIIVVLVLRRIYLKVNTPKTSQRWELYKNHLHDCREADEPMPLPAKKSKPVVIGLGRS